MRSSVYLVTAWNALPEVIVTGELVVGGQGTPTKRVWPTPAITGLRLAWEQSRTTLAVGFAPASADEGPSVGVIRLWDATRELKVTSVEVLTSPMVISTDLIN